MKFMLLIGGNRDAWAALTPEDWSDNEKAHGELIADLKKSGEFIECDELNVTPQGARIVRTDHGAPSVADGPLHDGDDFASGYYLLDCADIDRACAIAARLYESRFAPIEVRQVGG
ncbi:YciI family protein [Lacisediminihabitans sp.]|uniref:YciI family protein n=1 Tax=Lacisediminihabitans sp. TaxID=2787631 RepID=UPI00374CAAFD